MFVKYVCIYCFSKGDHFLCSITFSNRSTKPNATSVAISHKCSSMEECRLHFSRCMLLDGSPYLAAR